MPVHSGSESMRTVRLTHGDESSGAVPRVPVPYERQTVGAVNPLARYAHRRRIALSVDRAADLVRTGGTVLDWGCGPGQFLHDLSERRSDLALWGLDPFQEITFPEVKPVADSAEVPDGSVDLVTALEVCEHLLEDELLEFVTTARRLLSPQGRVLVSVPIVGGPPFVVKQANFMFVQRRFEYTLKEAIRVTFGGTVQRPVGKKNTHKGFDFRALRRRLSGDLHLVDRWVSPVPHLPWWLNSQEFTLWSVRQSP